MFAAIALRRAGKIDAQDVPRVFEELVDAPFGSAITLETDAAEPRRMMRAPRCQARTGTAPLLAPVRQRVRRHRTSTRSPLGRPPRLLRRPTRDVGEMTPAQLLGCADMFTAMLRRRVTRGPPN